jgi:hypothetical protein
MSNDFAKSEWCQWEVDIVQERRRRLGRDVFLLVMLKNITSKYMSQMGDKWNCVIIKLPLEINRKVCFFKFDQCLENRNWWIPYGFSETFNCCFLIMTKQYV